MGFYLGERGEKGAGNVYGIHYQVSIGSVQFVIQIFGQLPSLFFLIQDINQSGRKQVESLYRKIK